MDTVWTALSLLHMCCISADAYDLSTVPQSELLINWPLLLTEINNDSYLLYMYIVDVQVKHNIKCLLRCID